MKMIDKLKEAGVQVDILFKIPIVSFFILVSLIVIVYNFMLGFDFFFPAMMYMFGLFLGSFFGIKILLMRIEQIDKEKE